MIKNRRKTEKRKRLFLFFLIFLLVLTVPAVALFLHFRPLLIKCAVSNAETILLNAANDAVISVLNDENYSYGDTVKLSRDENCSVTSIETDIIKINSFKAKISSKLSQIVDEREYYTVSLPVGALVSDSVFNGMGPELKYKMQLTATAKVDFSNSFTNAGINNLLHTVNVEININGSLVTAGSHKSFSVSTSYIAAQTLINGDVPGAYTFVSQNSDDTAGLINDYGATEKGDNGN